MKKKAILLVNLGTPDSPHPKDVGKYLTQFLNDPFVIDIPQPWRWILVNALIIPLRKFKSAGLYKKIWTSKGSPLQTGMQDLTKKLQEKLLLHSPEILVDYAMRYGNPSIEEKIQMLSYLADEITVFPLYPQYASSTTGSTFHYVNKVCSMLRSPVDIHFVSFFFHEKFYLQAKAEIIKKFPLHQYDAFVFSYHGLPIRQIKKCSDENQYSCLSEECCSVWNNKNYYCYRAQCMQTTRLLAAHCQIDPLACLTTFQSRLSKNWLQPFTDETILALAKKNKKILVISPSFVTDCLETLYELGTENKEFFLGNGGKLYHLVPSLNDSQVWVNALEKFILEKIFS